MTLSLTRLSSSVQNLCGLTEIDAQVKWVDCSPLRLKLKHSETNWTQAISSDYPMVQQTAFFCFFKLSGLPHVEGVVIINLNSVSKVSVSVKTEPPILT